MKCNESSAEIDKIYNTVLRLTKQCGNLIKERIWEPKSISEKDNARDLVTETDKEIETLLVGGLSAEFPEHKFIGEETAATGVKSVLTAAPTWIIDPVDGTMNFVHGFPCVCISIALLIEKTAEIGIIYNPVLGQLFTAKKGQGAFLNGKKIKTSATTDLKKSLIFIEFGSDHGKERMAVIEHNFNLLKPIVHAVRTSGSSAWNMAIVGLGGAEAFFEFGLHAWDMAAGDLIVREAGGTVIDPCGGPLDLMSSRLMCTGTESIAQQLTAMIKQFYPHRDDE